MRELPTKVIPIRLNLYHVNQSQANGDDASLFIWANDIAEAAQIYLTTAALYEWDLENSRYKDNASVTGVMMNTVRVPLQRPPNARALEWEPLLKSSRAEANRAINRQVEADCPEIRVEHYEHDEAAG